MSTTAPTTADPSAAPLMLSQMIDQLSPAPVPATVSWLPQTWGWAVLAAVVLLLLLWVGWRRYRYWQANRYRAAALNELHQRLAAGEGAAVLTEVLRRTALVAFPRAQVAALQGQAWCDFLNQSASPACFDAQAISQLSALTYRPQALEATQLAALQQRVERWILIHRVQGASDD